MRIEIEERVVVQKPPSILETSSRRKLAGWTKRMIRNVVEGIRHKYIAERGVDIFQVFQMTDCIEVTLSGEIDVIPHVPKGGIVRPRKIAKRGRGRGGRGKG